VDQIAIDIDLVQRAQKGEKSAFLRLYEEHAGHIYAVCLRMLADTEAAKEAAQEAAVQIWLKLGDFRGESPFSAWIHRIAINTVLDHLRSEKRRHARVEFSNDADFGEDDAPQKYIDLEDAIASLPPQSRTVLILHDIEGYRHEEIGTMIGIASGTSKAHLHRARMLLKVRLQR
jgi:RNA polymerase sigma-70 factor (ECF subfamily)